MIDSDHTAVQPRREAVRPPKARTRRIAADASYDETLGVAGLGVGVGGQLFAIACSGTVSCGGSHEAEALAVLKALDYIADERGFPRGAEVLTDSRSVVRALAGSPDRNGDAIDAGILRLIRDALDRHGYLVRHVARSETRAAHRAARMALQSWRAGAEGVVSWSPSTCVQGGEG